MNGIICPVIFQKSDHPSPGDDKIFKNCKIVFGRGINEIIIKSILPDERESRVRKWMSEQGAEGMSEQGFSKCKIESEIKEFQSDRFGIPFGNR